MNEEWVKDYLARSGDDEIATDCNLVENENGFIVWNRYKDQFVIINCYGNGRYWDEWSNNKAKEIGCTTVFASTKRNPAPYLRKYGGKLVGYLMEREVI